MARVLIAGCGEVGTALGLLLAGDGHEVLGLRRRPDRLPPPIVPVRADLASRPDLERACAGAEVAVYTASADAFDDDAYRRAYVEGPDNLLAGLRAAAAPVAHVLFTSSTAVYGQTDGERVDEGSPAEPTGFSGVRLLEAERLLLDSGFPATVLRLAGIYGPGRTRLIDEVRSGEAVCFEGPPTYTNRIHVADCAGALHHLIRERAPGVFLGVDHEAADRCAVLDWLADRLGVARPRRVPPPATRGGRGAASKRCSNAKLSSSGYTFRYPSFREGYDEMLDAAARDSGPAPERG